MDIHEDSFGDSTLKTHREYDYPINYEITAYNEVRSRTSKNSTAWRAFRNHQVPNHLLHRKAGKAIPEHRARYQQDHKEPCSWNLRFCPGTAAGLGRGRAQEQAAGEPLQSWHTFKPSFHYQLPRHQGFSFCLWIYSPPTKRKWLVTWITTTPKKNNQFIQNS